MLKNNNNYTVIYLGSAVVHDHLHDIMQIFAQTTYNIAHFLHSPFEDIDSEVLGLIASLASKFALYFPKVIEFVEKRRRIRLFIVKKIMKNYIYHNGLLFNHALLQDDDKYLKLKKIVFNFLSFLKENNNKYKFIFIRMKQNKNTAYEIKKTIEQTYNLKKIILIMI